MAPLTSTDSRRFPVWGWVVLIGAVLAVLAVVLGPGAQPPVVDPLPGPSEAEPSEPQIGPQLADPGAPPEQPWASELLTVELRNLGGIEEERISPKRAGSMEGAVLDETKQGIEGARLTIVGGPQEGWSTVSRKQGHYLFPELLPGTHFFRIDVPGYGSTVRSHRVRGVGRSWRDFRVAPAIGVELVLRDHENKLLAGARVYTGLSDQEILSDENGIARVPPMVGGERVLLTIRADGHVPVRQELNLMIRPANAPPIEVPALPEGARVLGKVLSWPGSPYPQVSVVPRSNKISTHKIAWETWQGVQIEPDGSFVLEDVPTSHLIDIRVFHPSGVTEPRLRSVQPAGHTPTRVEFVIKRGEGRVAGRVVDANGAALPSARLVLEAVDPAAMLGNLYPGLELSPSTAMLPVPAPLRRELRARNDGGFDFAVGDHPEGTGSLVLTVSAPGYQSRRLPIRRSFSNLEIKLALEDHSSALQLLARDRPALPKIEWYLDGRLVEEIDGLAIEASTAKLSGLASGLYDVLVRSGGEVVRHDRELRIDGSTIFEL
jgi:hypothetical protein